MANYDSNYSIALEIYNGLGGEPAEFDSVYSILLGILPLVGGGTGSNVIDDNSIVPDKTWSSNKINTELETLNDNIYNLIYSLHPGADYLNFSSNLPNTKVRLVRYSKYAAEPSTPIDIDYSFDRINWTHYTVGNNITIPTDGKVYLRGNNDYFSVYQKKLLYYHHFEFENGSQNTFNVEAHGNINSLLSKTKWNEITTLPEYCYYSMFQGCSNLTTAPELPATTLAGNCYYSMFQGCTSLTTAPALPATTLANNCYSSMFKGCTSLTTAPALPATTLANYCYSNMFNGCTSLTTAPELPATTLADYCYRSMFQGCSNLTTAPALPATTLVNNCYQSMFQGCTSLTTAPELPATTLANYCYNSMFKGCTNLNYIKCLATDISASNSTMSWTNGVSASGTFVKNPNMTSWTTDSNGIPSGWTVQDA